MAFRDWDDYCELDDVGNTAFPESSSNPIAALDDARQLSATADVPVLLDFQESSGGNQAMASTSASKPEDQAHSVKVFQAAAKTVKKPESKCTRVVCLLMIVSVLQLILLATVLLAVCLFFFSIGGINKHWTASSDQIPSNVKQLSHLDALVKQLAAETERQVTEIVFNISLLRERANKKCSQQQQRCSGCRVEYFGTNCYLIPKNVSNWTEAKEFCKHLNGNLVSIESAQENYHLSTLENDFWCGLNLNHGASNPCSPENPLRTATAWKWDGTGKQLGFSKWINGEPNGCNPNNLNAKNCVQVTANGWKDIQCNSESRFICEFDGY